MPHLPHSRSLLLGTACLAMATLAGPAPADVYFETDYVPTNAVIGTSTLLPTAYVVPTSFSTTTYLPTSYLPTSYLSTSSVLATESVVYPTSTTYFRRSVFRPWRYIERTYSSYYPTTRYLTTSSLVPTTYVASSRLLPTYYLSSPTISPTAYLIDRGVVTTSATATEACETSPMPIRATVSRPSDNSQAVSRDTIRSLPSNASIGTERRPQGMIDNGPATEEGSTSPVKANDVPPPAVVPAAKSEPSPPPATPLDEKKPEDFPLPQPGKSGGSAQPGETSFRSSRRPSSYDGRNILRGRVISAESKLPEEGVTVIITNVTKTFVDRQAMSDADGEFKISLPDGDWAVKVKMPSGSVYQVGRDIVTASNGRVMDPSGRLVAEFLISR